MHRPSKLEYKPVERTVLVLLKLIGNQWKFTGDEKARTLQDWINLFYEVKAGKEYHWEILHTTSAYIIVERTKWEKIE